MTGYSRELETEADVHGLGWMARAGYEPAEAVAVFEHLRREYEESGIEEPFFFGTHPQVEERIRNTRELVATRYAGAAGAPDRRVGAEEYAERVGALLLDNAELDLEIGRLRTAEAAIARHLERWPQTARAHFLLGDVRRRGGRAGEAIVEYEEAARLDTAYAAPHRELGLLYRELGRTDDARAAFERYLALAPDATDAPIVRWYLRQIGVP